MATTSAMFGSGPDEPPAGLHDGLLPCAALAFARFPEVVMALGSPTLADEFELPPSSGSCTVIQETGDYKLVQVSLRRMVTCKKLGSAMRCTTGDVQQQEIGRNRAHSGVSRLGGGGSHTGAPRRLSSIFRKDGDTIAVHQEGQAESAAGRCVVPFGNASSPAIVDPPRTRANEVQSVIESNGYPTPPSSFAASGAYDAPQQELVIAVADGLFVTSFDDPGVVNCRSESEAYNRKLRDGFPVGHPCSSTNSRRSTGVYTLEDLSDNAEVERYSYTREGVVANPRVERGSDNKVRSRTDRDGPAVRYPSPQAEEWCSAQGMSITLEEANTNLNDAGHPCVPPTEWRRAEFQAAPKTPDKLIPDADSVGAGKSRQIGLVSEHQNERLCRSEAQAHNQGKSHTGDDNGASATTKVHRKTWPPTKAKKREGRKASLGSLEEVGFEPASPRSPGSYRPWGPASTTKNPARSRLSGTI